MSAMHRDKDHTSVAVELPKYGDYEMEAQWNEPELEPEPPPLCPPEISRVEGEAVGQ